MLTKYQKAQNFISANKTNELNISEFLMFEHLFYRLLKKESVETIMENVAKKFQSFGFKIEQNGGWWEIYD